MRGCRERVGHFLVLKVAPKVAPGVRFFFTALPKRPFWPKMRILGSPGGISEDSVASAPTPIPDLIPVPNPAPAPISAPAPAPAPSLNVDFDRNLSQNLNGQPQPQTLNLNP